MDRMFQTQRAWTHWDLNPSACEADVIPLHHEPVDVHSRRIRPNARSSRRESCGFSPVEVVMNWMDELKSDSF